MEKLGKYTLLIIIAAFLATPAMADLCAICGKEITGGTIYTMTDDVTGETVEVCANCLKLPRCYVCSLPVNSDGMTLPDGRSLCARDKKTAILTEAEAQRVASEVQDRLERLFARFTTFPTNVDVTVLDRIDVDQLYQPGGNDFESPNLLGCTKPVTDGNVKRYSVRLLTGLPLAEMQATAAHEFSHTWVGENVSPERHRSLSRDAEEGFCELVGYLLMDSQNEEAQKKFILKNTYTRGQVELFIEGNRLYGFDQILDWMQYGDTSRLEPGRLDKIRDVIMPKPASIVGNRPAVNNNPLVTSISNPFAPNDRGLTATESKKISAPRAAPAPESIRIEGLFWGKPPSAIINGHSVFPDDRFKVTIGGKTQHLHCLEIRKDSILIENTDTGKKEELKM